MWNTIKNSVQCQSLFKEVSWHENYVRMQWLTLIHFSNNSLASSKKRLSSSLKEKKKRRKYQIIKIRKTNFTHVVLCGGISTVIERDIWNVPAHSISELEKYFQLLLCHHSCQKIIKFFSIIDAIESEWIFSSFELDILLLAGYDVKCLMTLEF